jgi:preprotein translocase subunit SecF
MVKKRRDAVKKVYEKQYKKLLLIPILLLILAFVQIGYQVTTTGDFLNRGISLKGGLTISIPTEGSVEDIESYMQDRYPENQVSGRQISAAGRQIGVIIEIDLPVEDEEEINSLLDDLSELTGTDKADINAEGIGSALSDRFFSAMVRAILLAFVLMGIIVFLYFRTLIPSLAVILAAFSNMVITLAIANMLDIKLGTAGIAAFLMMIGYSVDTDILLSIKVLKNKAGTIIERVYGALSTGLTMNFTTLSAVSVALIVSESEVITQIMTILFIGLWVDMINTWIQNVGILRMYLERKGQK